ncbi:oligosaccharide flippase family protein [Clostridium uliginosum]|uniref:Membrane protein involved in the export of O-antigen and teichoic acid n=1 Tax=Clostridium uliginosum TaxID=119641 RepID=A0A1I1LTD9_9CLOT|nr:oligosaccharide flippase family protein [Clostridium uliginosum]SFC76196.1 Membrane protein involved in the export of O-antigen and teichoic acid [Clostridium uliginosum]
MSKSISKNAAFKSILNLFNIILPIIVMPVVTRSLDPTSYSYITKGETFNMIFLAFASFGVYQYGLREISKVRDDEKKVRQAFTSLFVITTFTTIIVSIIYMIFLFKFYRNDPAFYTCVILGLNIVFNLFYVEWINEALENYDFIAIKTMIVKIIYSVIILCFVRGQDDFLFYLYLGGAVNLINNILSYFYIKKRIKFDFSNLNLVQYIKPMFLVVILSNAGLLYTQLDRIMIDKYSFSMDLASYGIAQKAMFIINTLILTIIQVTMPRLSNNLGNNYKDNYLTLLNKVVKIYFLFLFPASIGLLCVSKQVMWIFNPVYVAWTPLMIAFSLYMLTVGIQGIISNQIIYLHKKEKEDIKIFFIGGVCNLVLNILFVITNMFTATNSIIATMLSNILVILLEYRIVKKQIKLDIHLFAFENIKYLYYSLLFIPITFVINSFIANIIISCALDMIICGLLYLGILLVTKDIVFFEIYDRAVTKLKALI